MKHVLTLEQFIGEGVYDPGILKAFFMAGGPGSGKSYDKVIELIRKEARRLNDDDAYEFHERLKEFFNKTI